VQATHVPYVQFPQAIADLVSGVNTFQFMTILPVVQLINTGKLRALAVTGPRRVPVLKDVPTVAEAEFPKLEAETWAGFLMKSGTPPPAVGRLNAAINKAIESEKVRTAMRQIGTDPNGGTPDQFGALMRKETARWARVVKDAGITISP
jgi:tripartite-type tricarboxylate transporter receptor subunit TctC